MSETMNMSQVSKVVSAFEPVTVKLSNDETVKVGRISWQGFEQIWNELAGLVAAFTMEGGDAGGLMTAIETKLKSAPDLVLKIIKESTNLSDEQLGDLSKDYANIFALASNAIDANFVQYRGVMGFFGVTMQVFADEKESENQSASAEKDTPSQPTKPSN